MSVLRTILSEAVSLFVDDGSLALAIVAWLLAAWLARPLLDGSPWFGAILTAGLLSILVENVLRRARK